MIAAIQFGCGFLSAMAISIPLIWRLGFGQVRHPLSIIGSISILLASAYVLRSKGIVRFGKRQIWIRFHRILASFGLTLIFVHGAFKPTYWFLATFHISSWQSSYRLGDFDSQNSEQKTYTTDSLFPIPFSSDKHCLTW